jgi:hypothetical protein
MRMVNQNWWITTLMIKEHRYCRPLTKDIKCDVLIVGTWVGACGRRRLAVR